MRRRGWTGLALLLATAACRPSPPPPPGYVGPMPGDGQAVAKDLQGRTLQDAAGDLGGGAWTVGPFSIGPKGPGVDLTQGTSSRTIRLMTDGDVADLYRRVVGTPHPTLTGVLSDEYRRSWR
ncbi:MAG TPA: hypothetical protein VEJ18_17830 [Planctomycetota bacterium]|nr:hypothetical protein [Planctomycetota bacterium]